MNEEGVWRTINGARVFIKKGQSTADSFAKQKDKPKTTNKYSGMFATGTEEQLQQAKRNLEFRIERLEQQIKSQEIMNKIAKGSTEQQLKINRESLAEVKLQYEELKEELKKREK